MLSEPLFGVQQLAGQPQRAASSQRGWVFDESVVCQTQLAHPSREPAAPEESFCDGILPRKPVVTFALGHEPGGLRAAGVKVKEEGQGGRGEAEVETEEDETFQVAELFLSEGVAAQRQEMADPWRANLHLGDTGKKGEGCIK